MGTPCRSTWTEKGAPSREEAPTQGEHGRTKTPQGRNRPFQSGDSCARARVERPIGTTTTTRREEFGTRDVGTTQGGRGSIGCLPTTTTRPTCRKAREEGLSIGQISHQPTLRTPS